MPTNIDTGLTVQDAVAADHSPHIFTMSNGDLVTIYYDGTNWVWRSKSGGSWSAKTTIALDTGTTPPKISYLTRNGDALYGYVSTDPIDATHNADSFQFAYTTSTHTLSTSNKQTDAGDGNEKAGGIGFISGASANNQVQILHSNSAGSFATVQQQNVNPTIVGTDIATTFTDFRSTARSGVLTDGASTTYLIYGIAATGTAFKVERIVTTGTTSTVESPTAPAANLIGIAGVWDGTNFLFIANENNGKIRALTRTGTNTYGSWVDVVTDAGITGEPAVCVKANGDLAVFYRTTTNQANGEIWVVQRTSGTWGSPALLAGGASTGWSNVSVAASDLNDAGNARVVYVTGTASTWTLVEDVYAFTTGGGGGGGSPAPATTNTAHGQWPNPLRITQRPAITPRDEHSIGSNNSNASTLIAAELFFGEVAPGSAQDTDVVTEAYGQWPNPLRITQRSSMLWRSHLNADTVTGGIAENDLTQAALRNFYGLVDQTFTQGMTDVSQIADALAALEADLPLAESATATDALASLQASFSLADTTAAADAVGIQASFSIADSGAAVDSVAIQANLSVADTLAASDALSSLSVSFTVADSMSAADSIGISASFSIADTISASDSVSIQASFTVADTAHATDAVSVQVSFTVADTASASDAIPSLVVSFTVGDTSTAIDSVTLGTPIQVSDAFAATDGLSITVSFTIAETMAAADSLSSLSSSFVVTDSMSALDLLGGVTTRFALAEAAAAADHVQVTQQGATPSGHGTATFLYLSGTVTFTFPDSVLVHLQRDGKATFTFTG